MPSVELLNLINEAEVTGIKYVGGIIGEVRIPSDRFVSVTIKDCKNTGAVYARDKIGTNNVDALKSGFIGGIIGYAANLYEADDGSKNTNLLQIVDCMSTPKYDAADINTLFDEHLNGVYVGGIVGYNYYGKIKNCSTKSEDGDVGYVFGHSFVGGITGCNLGPVDGSSENEKSVNTANVIGVKYVGGIAGCNADLEEGQDEIEALETVATPKRDVHYNSEIRNWENKGFVFAVDCYTGGVSGYNTGWIYNCDSNIDSSQLPMKLKQSFSGDYVGGIAGYNNGIIGNTLRDTMDKTQIIETASADERKIYISSNISGTSYVGGIVGYNDEQAVIEDYVVDGGFVRGAEHGCFVGGYVGFNASLDLLQSGDGSAKTIEASPSSVSGGYFVGGILGGNIINTSGYTASTTDIPVYSAPTIPKVTDDEVTDTPAPIIPDNPTETPTNDFTLSFDRTNAYMDGNGVDIISQYSISAVPKNGASVSDWRIEIDIPDGVEVRLCQAVNHTFLISNNKLIIIPMNENDYLPGGSLDFSIYTKSSIDYFKFTNSEARLYVDNILRAVKARTLTIQTNRDFTVSLTPYGVWQNETGKYIAGYNYSITNTSDKTIEGWGFEIDVNGRDFEVYSGWIRYEHKNGKLIIVPQFVYNNTILPGATITCPFQIIGDNPSDVENLQLGTIHKYEYYEAASSKPNEPPVDAPAFERKYAINTSYSANNTEEIVSGNAFVGGFIGYNLLIDNSDTGTEYGYVNDLSKQIVNAITGNSGSLTAQYNVVDTIDSIAGLTSNLNVSDVAFVINGQTSANQVNRLKKIEGNICVGGIVGFCNEENRLYIKNTTNNTPIFANQDIADANNSFYSYAGGIIGTVGFRTVLENCSADLLSIIASKGNYSGSICEINNGYLLNCSASVIYSDAKNYAAGLCGINQKHAMIKNCMADGVSVTGQEMAGALVAENYGYIQNPSVNNISVVCAGAAGGVAAYNGESGIILLVHNIGDIYISSTGDNVGGVAGINDGVIVTASAEDDYKITVTGSVSGHDTVGGIVGKNTVHNDDSKIGFFVNRTTVTAEEGNVGGIVGYNQKVDSTEGRVADCVNYGTVTSKGSGYAGGICAINDMKVLRCKNYGELFAAEGKGDGIVAFNREGATVFACASYQAVSNYIETNMQSVMSTSYKIPMQEMPEISDFYEVSTSGNLIYTFSWDIDKNYENAVYDTKLLGINTDGSFDLLGEQTNVSNNTVSFEDVSDVWDYAKLKLIVTRQGRYDKEANIHILANSGEKEFQSKVSLSSVPVDGVRLSEYDNGTTNKDSLVYAVSFSPIQAASEKQAVAYYKIVVSKPVSLLDGSVSYDICYEKNIYPNAIDDSQDNHTEIIDLSRFEGEHELKFAVKAIAKYGQEVYRDSRPGAEYVLTVPQRLEAIAATAIRFDVDSIEPISETELNQEGITLSVSDNFMESCDGNYELAVAIFDFCEGEQTNVANSGDSNPSDELTYWNSGARITIASKNTPLVMDGNTLDYATCVLGNNVKLSDYAGKWFKIAVRRTGDKYLNSAWSDEDANGKTVNYLWIQIPQVIVDMPAFADKQCLDTIDEYYDGSNWSLYETDDCIKKIRQRAIILKECDYADTYNLHIMNDCVRKISIVKRLEGYNTVFDVYYIGFDSGRITGVFGEPYDFWKYLGTFDSENDIVDLPFTRELETQITVDASETDYETEEQSSFVQTVCFSKCASIRKTEDGFLLVLPYESNEFFGKVTVQACVDVDEAAYVNSPIGCYISYYDNMYIEDVFTIDDSYDAVLTEMPKVSATVETNDFDTMNITYNLTSNSDLIMVQMIVFDENNNMKWTEYKSICMDYDAVDALMHGSFTIDAKEYFITEPKQTVTVRFATVDQFGLGEWTDYYELTLDGVGSLVDL
ncbi:MAG: GLUG motif-containing protein [Lachnospiraceae bacterium]|nr:GLUG motif-containing protein [Lachnospiraceae bacterium]